MEPINGAAGFNPLESYKQRYLAEQCKHNIAKNAECRDNVWLSILQEPLTHQKYWDGYMDLTTKLQQQTNPELVRAHDAEAKRIKEVEEYHSPEAIKAREDAKKAAEVLKRQQDLEKENPQLFDKNMFGF